MSHQQKLSDISFDLCQIVFLGIGDSRPMFSHLMQFCYLPLGEVLVIDLSLDGNYAIYEKNKVEE